METDPDDTVQSYCVLLFRKSQLNLLETLATTRVTPVLHRARFVSIAVFTESTASVKCERWRQENDPTTAEPASSRPEVCRTAGYWRGTPREQCLRLLKRLPALRTIMIPPRMSVRVKSFTATSRNRDRLFECGAARQAAKGPKGLNPHSLRSYGDETACKPRQELTGTSSNQVILRLCPHRDSLL